MKFLEVMKDKGKANRLIDNTLLELYLRDSDVLPETKKSRLEKALTLMNNPRSSYDEGVALALCEVQGFKHGQLYLYERMELYNEILQYYMDMKEYKSVTKTCKKYSKVAPYLWAIALRYFTSQDNPSLLKQEIVEVLCNIESNHIFHPTHVVKVLSYGNATLGLMSDYIHDFIQRGEKDISEDTKRLKSIVEEMNKNKQEILELKEGVKKFQLHKCVRCLLPLDLPSCHFLCNHSFHQRCLGENESVCPECAEETKDFRNRQRILEESARKHSEFFRQLENTSSEGFSVIAKYFGRGVFDKPLVETIEVGVLPTLDPGLFKDFVGDFVKKG
eukprot:TRINITY_DN15191_c1_g1_i1.p1 TRINITY_DN15191_c1_g1~~TRINITY_DN15191_c1_g1_i1.p1  ORF type:complete len:332 (-),score=76.20 TRINITY_DN15191_c1_g1_i1:48-1043(-)